MFAAGFSTALWRLSFICFPIFLQSELNLLACVDVDGVNVVLNYPSVVCGESEHVLAVSFLGIAVVVLIFGAPYYMLKMLRPACDPAKTHPRLFGRMAAPYHTDSQR